MIGSEVCNINIDKRQPVQSIRFKPKQKTFEKNPSPDTFFCICAYACVYAWVCSTMDIYCLSNPI